MHTTFDSIREDLQDGLWVRRVEGARRAQTLFARGELDQGLEQALCVLLNVAGADLKWEVRKAAALALGEIRHALPQESRLVLDRLNTDSNPWVRRAASTARAKLRSRSEHEPGWEQSQPAQDPVPEYVSARIAELGLSPQAAPRIYDLIMERSEDSYRQLASEMAHEVKNLITPIKVYFEKLDAAAGSVERAEQNRKYARMGLEGVDRLKLLVDQLTIYSAPPEMEFALVNLKEVVNHALRNAKALVEGNPHVASPTAIEIIDNVPEEMALEVLPERLERAILNIVANALYALEGEGRLTISAKLPSVDAVELEIEDTGPGMTIEQANGALQRFRTSRKESGGTGLGLPIAQRIVERDHQGALSIDSERGRGTRVRLLLPVRRKQS